jgi:aspartate carbamoyltransferase catalytic subunit
MHEILFLLDEAEQWVELNRQRTNGTTGFGGSDDHQRLLRKLDPDAAFSFEIAGKRLGADVVNMHAAQSSVKKGETLIDTAMTLNAMHADAIVIRHGFGRGAVDRRQRSIARCSTPATASMNTHAGVARRADHPPCQGRDFAGLTVVICGDMLHSRVARSNIHVPDHAGRRCARLRAAIADAGRDRGDEGNPVP